MTNYDDVSARVAADEAVNEMMFRGDAELDRKHGEPKDPTEGVDSETIASYNLRRIRKVLGVSQQQIADRLAKTRPCGVKLSQTQIAKIERGERPWRLNELMAIADALGLHWDEFFHMEPGADYRALDVEAARLRYEQAKAYAMEARDAWRQAVKAEYEAEEEFLRTSARHGIKSGHVMMSLELRALHQDYVKDVEEDLQSENPFDVGRGRESLAKAKEYAEREWGRLLEEESNRIDE